MIKNRNNRIDVKRMFEIEKLRFCQYQNLKGIELEYLKLALKMPIEEISEIIILNDNVSRKVDEEKIISKLQEKYLESRENVLKRIIQVKQINKYEEGLFDSKKFNLN